MARRGGCLDFFFCCCDREYTREQQQRRKGLFQLKGIMHRRNAKAAGASSSRSHHVHNQEQRGMNPMSVLLTYIYIVRMTAREMVPREVGGSSHFH